VGDDAAWNCVAAVSLAENSDTGAWIDGLWIVDVAGDCIIADWLPYGPADVGVPNGG
jgi:hypothetical protein